MTVTLNTTCIVGACGLVVAALLLGMLIEHFCAQERQRNREETFVWWVRQLAPVERETVLYWRSRQHDTTSWERVRRMLAAAEAELGAEEALRRRRVAAAPVQREADQIVAQRWSDADRAEGEDEGQA